jgi:hypothetical protein
VGELNHRSRVARVRYVAPATKREKKRKYQRRVLTSTGFMITDWETKQPGIEEFDAHIA